VRHSAVELALQQKGNKEPIDADKTVVGALVEEKADCDNNSEWSFKD
jgi:hypothetical protein